MNFHDAMARLVCGAAVVGFSFFAHAANYTWSGGAAGDWAVNENWGGSGYPNLAGDTATVAESAAISLGGGSYAMSGFVLAKGSATLDGGTITLDSGMIENNSSGGTLTFRGMTLVNSSTDESTYKNRSLRPYADGGVIAFVGDNSCEGFWLRSSNKNVVFSANGGTTTITRTKINFTSACVGAWFKAENAVFSIDADLAPPGSVNLSVTPGDNNRGNSTAAISFSGDITLAEGSTLSIDASAARNGTYRIVESRGGTFALAAELCAGVSYTDSKARDYELGVSDDGRAIILRLGSSGLYCGVWSGSSRTDPTQRVAVVGTSFEKQSPGAFDSQVDLSWYVDGDASSATVKKYAGEGEPYAYATTKQTAPCAAEVSASGHSAANQQYLSLPAMGGLEAYRLAAPRIASGVCPVSLGGGYVYDQLVRFTACDDTPDVADGMQLQLYVEGGTLKVAAGRFCDGIRHVTPWVYDSGVAVKSGVWRRLTVMVIGDLTDGGKVPGYVVYLDGNRIGSSEPVFADFEKRMYEWFTPDARTLLRNFAVFPGRAPAATDEAAQTFGFKFGGGGAIDDVTVSEASSNACAFTELAPTVVLKWDAGVSSVGYRFAGEEDYEYVEDVSTGYVDIPLRSRAAASIEVDVAYDASRGYSAGEWTGEGGCTPVTGGFDYDGKGASPVANIVSYREQVLAGDPAAGYSTLAAALAAARSRGIHAVKLAGDIAFGEGDEGEYAAFTGAGDDFTLDLAGRTMRAAAGVSAIMVSGGASLTVVDTVGGGLVVSADSTFASPAVSFVGRGGTALKIVAGTYQGLVRVSSPELGSLDIEPTEADLANCAFLADESDSFYLESYVTNRTVGFVKKGEWWQMARGYAIDYDAQGGTMPATYVSRYTDRTAPAPLPVPTLAYYDFDGWYDATGKLYTNVEQLVESPFDPSILLTARWTPYVPLENIAIWTGQGEDDSWSTAANWSRNYVPTADDWALFPTNGATWSVDCGNGEATTAKIYLDADVALSGTLNATGATFHPDGRGRFAGAGTIDFAGSLPPDMSAVLGSAWRGTVAIANATGELSNIASWGVAGSTVRFTGVEGDLGNRVAFDVPYTLDLVNGDGGYAWRCLDGHTGITVTFAKITGSGELCSPALETVEPTLQVFRMLNVSSFTGRLDFATRRVVIGSGNPAVTVPGSITYADGAVVNLRHEYDGDYHTWHFTNAWLGASLDVLGEPGAALLEFDDPEGPDLTTCLKPTIGTAAAELYTAGAELCICYSSEAYALAAAPQMASSAGDIGTWMMPIPDREVNDWFVADGNSETLSWKVSKYNAILNKTGLGTFVINGNSLGGDGAILASAGTLEIGGDVSFAGGVFGVAQNASLALTGNSLVVSNAEVRGSVSGDGTLRVLGSLYAPVAATIPKLDLTSAASVVFDEGATLTVDSLALGSSPLELDVSRFVSGRDETLLISSGLEDASSFALVGLPDATLECAGSTLILKPLAIDVAEGETKLGGSICGKTGILNKRGEGTLIFDAASSGNELGGFAIREGTVILNGVDLSALGTGTVSVASNTRLYLDDSASLDNDPAVVAESLIRLDGGTLATSANTYSPKLVPLRIVLDDDSTIDGDFNLTDLITIDLNGHTLTKTGGGAFAFCGGKVVGEGLLRIAEGALAATDAVGPGAVAIEIAPGARADLTGLGAGELTLGNFACLGEFVRLDDVAVTVTNRLSIGSTMAAKKWVVQSGSTLEFVTNSVTLDASEAVSGRGTGTIKLDLAGAWTGKVMTLVNAPSLPALSKFSIVGSTGGVLYYGNDALCVKPTGLVTADVAILGDATVSTNLSTIVATVETANVDYGKSNDRPAVSVVVIVSDPAGNEVARASRILENVTGTLTNTIAVTGVPAGGEYRVSAIVEAAGLTDPVAESASSSEVMTARVTSGSWIDEDVATYTGERPASGVWSGAAPSAHDTDYLYFGTLQSESADFVPNVALDANAHLYEVELSVKFDGFEACPEPPAGTFAAATLTADDAGEAALALWNGSSWQIVSRSAFAPETGREYAIRFTVMRNSNTVVCRVDGAVVAQYAASGDTTLGKLSLAGSGALRSIGGILADANLAVAGGVEYATVEEAVAANAGDVTPLTNSTCRVSGAKGEFTVFDPDGLLTVVFDDGLFAEKIDLGGGRWRYRYNNARNWIDYADSAGVEITGSEYVVNTAAGLAHLAVLAQGGFDFAGCSVSLGADIDLSAHDWTPIAKFKGVFDGKARHIIGLRSGEYSAGEGCPFGLFAEAARAEFANVTFEDVAISNSLFVGASALVGHVAGDCKISSVVLKDGFIAGHDKVGSVVGVADSRCQLAVQSISFSDISVSLINPESGSVVAGVVGYAEDCALLEVTGCVSYARMVLGCADGSVSDVHAAGIVAFAGATCSEEADNFKVNISNCIFDGVIISNVVHRGAGGGNVALIGVNASDGAFFGEFTAKGCSSEGRYELSVIGSDDRLLNKMVLVNAACDVATYDECGEYSFNLDANGNGVTVLDPVTRQARMSHERYEDDAPNDAGSVRDAITAVAADSTVTVDRDLATWDEILVDRDLTVDLGGMTLAPVFENAAFYIAPGVSLTVRNGRIAATRSAAFAGDTSSLAVENVDFDPDIAPSSVAVEVAGEWMTLDQLVGAARSGDEIFVLSDDDVAIDGNAIVLAGEKIESFADYYDVAATSAEGGLGVSLRLNDSAIPEIGASPAVSGAMLAAGGAVVIPALEVTGGEIFVNALSTRTGLYYGLASGDSPSGEFTAPASLVPGRDGANVRLAAEASASACFYRIYVTDRQN